MRSAQRADRVDVGNEIVPSPSMLRIGSVWCACVVLGTPDSNAPTTRATKQNLRCMFMIDILTVDGVTRSESLANTMHESGCHADLQGAGQRRLDLGGQSMRPISGWVSGRLEEAAHDARCR
jgi:hypothetical protein